MIRSFTTSTRSLAMCGASVGLCFGILLAPAAGVAQSHMDSIPPLPVEGEHAYQELRERVLGKHELASSQDTLAKLAHADKR